jgi:Fe-S-cluster-containing hydrogenase component 2
MAHVIAEDCVGCGSCVDVCPVEAIELVDDVAVIDEEECTGCMTCVDECPMEAISEE